MFSSNSINVVGPETEIPTSPPEIVFERTAVVSPDGGSTSEAAIPTSFAVNVLPETVTLPSAP